MTYYLEAASTSRETPARIDIGVAPVVIGRQRENDICIPVSNISRNHARLQVKAGQLWVEDLGSTNGTFVNHKRIDGPTSLDKYDIVHFADYEFCVREADDFDDEPQDTHTRFAVSELPQNFPVRAREFVELVEQGLVEGYKQKITLHGGELYGYELLGRGCHPNFSSSPYDMFKAAADLNMEVQLSEILRVRSFEQAAAAKISEPLFFNSHPKECRDPQRLLSELERLRQRYPQLNLVFEVHEAAVTEPVLMREICGGLEKLNIALAYDDFGAGQARLLELTEVPPSILKFDIGLVSGVGESGSAKYRMLQSLNQLVKDMGIATLAEGVETQAVADACAEMGIDFFQGYFYSRPEAIAG